MDSIEIIVTHADSTPTSSSTALNKIANCSSTEAASPKPNLELHFNALNKTSSNTKKNHSNRTIRQNPSSQAKNGAGTTSSSSNYITPSTSSDESKRPLLPASPSSTSLQLSKKNRISPVATSNNSTATTPSPTMTNTVPIRANPPSKFFTNLLFLQTTFFSSSFLFCICVGSCFDFVRHLHVLLFVHVGCSYTTPHRFNLSIHKKTTHTHKHIPKKH